MPALKMINYPWRHETTLHLYVYTWAEQKVCTLCS